MPRVKPLAVRNEAAAERSHEISLRLRSASGIHDIHGLFEHSKLSELRATCEAVLGSSLASLSFRGDVANISLISDGQYPALGALLVGPDSEIGDVGIGQQTLLMASIQSSSPPGKRRPSVSKGGASKKIKAPRNLTPRASIKKDEGTTVALSTASPDDDDYERSDSDDADSSNRSSGCTISGSGSGGAKKSPLHKKVEPLDIIARSFVHSGSGGGGIGGTQLVSHFQVQASGQKRLDAASRGLVTVTEVTITSSKTVLS
jgi:hypothetical protein